MSGSEAQRRRLFWRVGSPIVLALILLACGSDDANRGDQPGTGALPGVVSIAPQPGSTGPRLQFFGDSITADSAGRLIDAFKDRYRVGIHAVYGVRTSELESHIRTVAEDPPDIVVINLGTNDAACGSECDDRDTAAFDPAKPGAPFDRLDDLFPSSTCMIFVNVNTHNPRWGPDIAAEINAHLEAFPRVVDWDRAWRASWFDLEGDPHPNPEGQRALSALIGAQVATCPVNGP